MWVYRFYRRKIVKPLSCSLLVVSHGDENALFRLLRSISLHVPPDNFEILICIPPDTNISNNVFSNKIQWIISRKPGIYGAFNTLAMEASGDVLFLADETLEFVSPESHTCLLEHVQREEVGAVGGKVYYENGLMEHGGVIFGPFGLLGHAHRATPDTPGYAGLNHMICNYSAVMGLGMMTRRKLFLEMGGFDGTFENAYWDADYCLRLRERGYLVTYTPYAKFRHHIPVKTVDQMRTEPEASLFKKRWSSVIENDPYFNINFSRNLENFTVKKEHQTSS